MWGTKRGPSAVAVTAVCLAAALSACSDDSPPDDRVSPTVTATTPAPTRTAVPTPTLPAAAKADKAGAEAFVRYFWDVVNYAFAGGGADLLESISDKSCTFCESSLKEVQRLKAEDSHIEGGKISVTGVAVPPLGSNNRVIVTAVLRQAAGRVVDADGQPVSVSKENKNLRTDVLVQWAGGRWKMLDVSFGGPSSTATP